MHASSTTALALLPLLLPARTQQDEPTTPPVDPVIELGASAAGSVDEVWGCLSTEEGLTSFLAPAALVDLRVGGPWEFGGDESGQAADGVDVRILDHVDGERLSIEWPVPERFPETAGTLTRAEISLRRMSDQRTLITVAHSGFGQGHEWSHVSQYFQVFWSNVLNSLRRRFDQGPVPWAEYGIDVAAARARMDERREAVEGPPQHWVVRLEPRSTSVVASPTPEEADSIARHFERLKRMLAEGSLLLAGPVTEEPYFGLLVFEAPDRRSAEAVLHGDPAVIDGVMTGSLQSFHLSLVRD